ncbi:MAG: hypothetical protein OXI35_13875 [Gemmatimonadota bacterium]|nr:hypothetical protein [Gemmatimonadota bacterium]
MTPDGRGAWSRAQRLNALAPCQCPLGHVDEKAHQPVGIVEVDVLSP